MALACAEKSILTELAPVHSGPAVAQNRDQLNQGGQRWNHVLTGVINSTETDFEHYFYVLLVRRGESWGGKHTAYDLFSEYLMLCSLMYISYAFMGSKSFINYFCPFWYIKTAKRYTFRGTWVHYETYGIYQLGMYHNSNNFEDISLILHTSIQ